ncbi:MAG TPA: glycosyltransferase family 4 protein [Allosphingosinicella sp.]
MNPVPPALSSLAGSQRVVVMGALASSLLNFRGPLIRALIGRGHVVFAVAPDIDEATAEALRKLGAQPAAVRVRRASLNPLGALRTGLELRQLLRRVRADVMIAYTIKPVVLGAGAARATGVKRFVPLVTGLGYAFTEGRGLKRRISRLMAMRLYRRAFARSAIAIFQNPDDRAEFQRLRLLPERLPAAVVNGSGVDLSVFRPAPLPDGPSFLMISRLLGDKGIREFAIAARRLKQQHPQVRIGLVGYLDDTPDSIGADELAAIVEGGVEFHGKLDDVRPAIAAYSVYVLPSYREGTPRSVLEALAIGRAIITTDAPGCRETVVDSHNGLLVPPRDPEALFEAMNFLVEHPDRIAAMAAASRRIAEEKYDADVVAANLLDYCGL